MRHGEGSLPPPLQHHSGLRPEGGGGREGEREREFNVNNTISHITAARHSVQVLFWNSAVQHFDLFVAAPNLNACCVITVILTCKSPRIRVSP